MAGPIIKKKKKISSDFTKCVFFSLLDKFPSLPKLTMIIRLFGGLVQLQPAGSYCSHSSAEQQQHEEHTKIRQSERRHTAKPNKQHLVAQWKLRRNSEACFVDAGGHTLFCSLQRHKLNNKGLLCVHSMPLSSVFSVSIFKRQQ